ncbi:MAG: hypothetical protein HY795_11605 [Desulfovibrio sp.]|nr:hypothetical protein [Desulfovibrio sp.]MBI4958968.1 hypothetical protein [Desulfovibrio sp.]
MLKIQCDFQMKHKFTMTLEVVVSRFYDPGVHRVNGDLMHLVTFSQVEIVDTWQDRLPSRPFPDVPVAP